MRRYHSPDDEEGAFGHGGLPYQLDSVLFALEEASRKEDAREYASLAAQLAVVLAPKLSLEEYRALSVPVLEEVSGPMSQRERRREYERRLFVAARLNVAGLLRLASLRGVYAKQDESPPPVHDASALAIVEEDPVLDAREA